MTFEVKGSQFIKDELVVGFVDTPILDKNKQ